MGDANAMLAASSGGDALTGAVGSWNQYKATKAAGEYQRRLADMNSRLAQIQAEDAIRRGDKSARQLQRDAKQLQGAQTAGYAAQGVDVSSGSAAAVQEETMTLAALDEMEIRNNAMREAWGHKMNALNYNAQGAMNQLSANYDAKNTLLTGGWNTVGSGVKSYYYASRRDK